MIHPAPVAEVENLVVLRPRQNALEERPLLRLARIANLDAYLRRGQKSREFVHQAAQFQRFRQNDDTALPPVERRDVRRLVARGRLRKRTLRYHGDAASADVTLEMFVGLVLDRRQARDEEDGIALRRDLLAEAPLAEDVRLVAEKVKCALEVAKAAICPFRLLRQPRLVVVGVEVGHAPTAAAQIRQERLRDGLKLRMEHWLVGPQRIVVPVPDEDAGKTLEELVERHPAELPLIERLLPGHEVVGEDVGIEAQSVLAPALPVDTPDENILSAVVEKATDVEGIGSLPALHVAEFHAVEPGRP